MSLNAVNTEGRASTRAARWVKNQGFGKLAQDPDISMPVLPPDITAIANEGVMVLFSEILAWIDFIEVQLAAIQIDEKETEVEIDKLVAVNKIKYKSERTVTLLKARTIDDADYQELQEKSLTIYARRKMLETVFNSLDRKRFLVSRELSRRIGT